jgi:mannose-6-phosphate isomerase-like protein (cupin superfamily)
MGQFIARFFVASSGLLILENGVILVPVTMAMNETELAKDLQSEGYHFTYVWQDRPGKKYPDHSHVTETTHIILEGEMTLLMEGKEIRCGAGDRCDVPAGAVHSAFTGPQGCRYIIGER